MLLLYQIVNYNLALLEVTSMQPLTFEYYNMHHLQQLYSFTERDSRFIKLPLFFLLCALLWLITSTITLNIYIQYQKKQILKAINKVEPKGRFFYSESIEDRNAIDEEIGAGSRYNKNDYPHVSDSHNDAFCSVLLGWICNPAAVNIRIFNPISALQMLIFDAARFKSG